MRAAHGENVGGDLPATESVRVFVFLFFFLICGRRNEGLSAPDQLFVPESWLPERQALKTPLSSPGGFLNF